MNRKNQFALSIIIACTLAASSYQGTFADDLDDQLQDIQGQIDESHNSQANWQEIIDQVNVKLRAIRRSRCCKCQTQRYSESAGTDQCSDKTDSGGNQKGTGAFAPASEGPEPESPFHLHAWPAELS